MHKIHIQDFFVPNYVLYYSPFELFLINFTLSNYELRNHRKCDLYVKQCLDKLHDLYVNKNIFYLRIH
jgi:hypothetical protein